MPTTTDTDAPLLVSRRPRRARREQDRWSRWNDELESGAPESQVA
jgi:hypothetical protein